MKRTFAALIIVALLLSLQAGPTNNSAQASPGRKQINVQLVYHPDYLKAAPHILAAYESVLEEEGIPFERMDVFELVNMNADQAAKTNPALILPDSLLQNVPEQFSSWIRRYVARGGNISVIYDVGTKNGEGFYLDSSVLADVVGLNYITYASTGASAYETGHIRFSSEAARDYFQIPLGKTIDRLVLSSYTYGPLQYPIARTAAVREIPEGSVYAYGITKKNEKFPLIVLGDYEKGKVLYVNLPLGYLKAYSDDLPLRSVLRTFLLDVVGIPHVMNVEQGRGGLVINWHVDSDIEHVSLPYLLKKGIFRKEIASSFHITAGDFFLTPGDDTGFDAAGEGRRLTLALKEYGLIGSHGGWAHNWFSDNINKGIFKEKEIQEYIAKNNAALEKIIGYKVTEYAAPNGAHPQPAATQALENLGIVAYYYVGDTGSPPNRVFAGGKMVSEKVIAFPIMPLGEYGSIWEIHALGKKTDAEVEKWLENTLDYIAHNRTVRLIYSHPYDYQNYPDVINKFFDHVVQMQKDKEINVRPMSDYANFFLRFLKTKYEFQTTQNQLIVQISNPEGLDGITVALPKKTCRMPVANGTVITEDSRYYYLTVVGQNEKEKVILVDTL